VFISQFNQLAFQYIENYEVQKAPPVTIIAGQEGLGKTQLLNCILQKMEPQKVKAVLIDADKFSKKFAFAAQNGSLNGFRHSMRSNDLFLLDNINVLQGKKKTLEELFHTVDTILAQGGKTVITYQGSTLNFDFLNQRFASRLKSGFFLYLKDPAAEELEHFIAYRLTGDLFQEIRPCLPALLSGIKNMKQAVKIAEQLKKDIQPANFADEKIRVPQSEKLFHLPGIGEQADLVVSIVCECCGLEKNKVLGSTKKGEIVEARQMVYLLLHEIFQYSYRDIASYFRKNTGSLTNQSEKIRESKKVLFETLCKKLYNAEKERSYGRG